MNNEQVTTWFQNRTCILATMHQKEKAMAELLETHLNLQVVIPQNFNTDIFGTFTREIKRLGTQQEAARLKAKQALKTTGASLAIASEGSFIPHPMMPYATCNRELVLLWDEVHQIEIVATAIALETNHAHASIQSLEEAFSFAKKVGFPSHGLVAMPTANPQNSEQIFKGIVTETKLVQAVTQLLEASPNGKIHLETDMRAMYNPTRMKVIAQATQNLIDKIFQTCPHCQCPGFDIVEHQSGLPCGMCHLPTDLIKADVYRCQKCQFQHIKEFPNQTQFADPTYCNYCNP